MRRTALHEYLSQIEGLLDDNRLPEAAAHCHFILQQYPRHIATYRLFGRALLEQQLFEEAIDVFERLLSADPEDLVSHAALALAFSESSDLARSLWHMERAFEIDPYNRAVQDELRKLYIARDGDAPARLGLTRAALARLHTKAGLYHQAIEAFGRLLEEHPDRIDLQLALADAMYWDSRITEAAELCQAIVERLPFCIKANAILANARLQSEQVEEARHYLKIVQALTMLDRAHLDPETTLGKALINSRITIPNSVQVEALEDTLAFANEFEELGAWPEQTAVLVDSDEIPDWLYEIGSPDTQAAGEATDSAIDVEQDQAEMAEWLDDASVEIADPASPELWDDVDSLSSLPDEELEEDLSEQLNGIVEGAALAEPRESSAEARVANEPVEVEPATQGDGAAIWDDESLLALDDLRAYIDAESVPEGPGTDTPEWLAELPERAEDTSELPDWLYEAVGIEASAQSTSESQISDETLTEKDNGEGGTATIDTAEGSGTGQDAAPFGLEQIEDALPRSVEDSVVPDWLLEGDDVLDELPTNLLAQADSTPSPDELGENASDSWLDELTAQLSGFEGTENNQADGADDMRDANSEEGNQ